MKAFFLQTSALLFAGIGGICVAHDMQFIAAAAYAIGLFFMELWREA